MLTYFQKVCLIICLNYVSGFLYNVVLDAKKYSVDYGVHQGVFLLD